MDGSAGKNGESATMSAPTNTEDSASLNEATGNFLAAMNWLGAGKAATATSEGAETWASRQGSIGSELISAYKYTSKGDYTLFPVPLLLTFCVHEQSAG